MRLIKSSLVRLVLAGILAAAPTAAFAHDGWRGGHYGYGRHYGYGGGYRGWYGRHHGYWGGHTGWYGYPYYYYPYYGY